MKKTVIIKGYYGRDNLGDELMMDVFARFFAENFGDRVNLAIMNSAPERVKKEYSLDTPAELVTGSYGKSNLIRRVRTICRADLYIIGGGTILTDKHGLMCLFEYMAEAFIRRLFSRKTVLASIGSTEFRTAPGRFACRGILRFSDKCLVRDMTSYRQLTGLYRSDKIIKTGDLVALALENTVIPRESCFPIRKIAVCAMPYHKSTGADEAGDAVLADRLAALTDSLCAQGYEVTLVPVQYGSANTLDLDFSERIASICKSSPAVRRIENCREKAEELSGYDLIISMRLHALLIGLMANVNVIAIDHNPKITALMELYGKQEFSVPLDGIAEIPSVIGKLTGSPDNSGVTRAETERARQNLTEIQKIAGRL